MARAMLRQASRVRSSSAWTDLNRPAARPEACDPAVWRSATATDRPATAQCRAVLRPSAPAPMTTTSASTRTSRLQRAPQQRVQPGERVVPARLGGLAELLGERALPQFEPGLAVALRAELQAQPDPGAPGPLDLLVPVEQLVLHDVGEGRVDRAAQGRGLVVHHHEPLEPAGPRVDLQALAGE